MVQCSQCRTTGWLSRLVQGSNKLSTQLDEIYNTPLTYSWNLTVQRQLPARLVMEVAYVGSKGIHQAEIMHILNGATLASDANPVPQPTSSTRA